MTENDKKRLKIQRDYLSITPTLKIEETLSNLLEKMDGDTLLTDLIRLAPRHPGSMTTAIYTRLDNDKMEQVINLDNYEEKKVKWWKNFKPRKLKIKVELIDNLTIISKGN